MHDLSKQTAGAMSSSTHTTRVQTYSIGQFRNTADELAEELRELEFLSDSYLFGLSNDTGETNWLLSSLVKEVKLLRSTIRSRLHQLERARRWSSSDELKLLTQQCHFEIGNHKEALRKLYSARGKALCAGDWQSPIYASSYSSSRNRQQDGIREHILDYKRDGHLEAKSYEQSFMKEYASHLGSSSIEAYLTNNGMAAFSSALHWITQEAKFMGKALAVVPMYFENLHLAEAFIPQLEQFNAEDNTVTLLEKLQKEGPTIVICDTVSNCGKVLVQPYKEIFQWAKKEEGRPIAIVLDATCSPAFLLEDNLLQELPDSVSVFIIESLAKYHQYGMDLVTGGIALVHSSSKNQVSFNRTRARFGANIVDSSVGSLPVPSKLVLEKRLRRHSRNVQFFSEQLERIIQVKPGLIESVEWQSRELTEENNWFRSSCLTLRFRPACSSIQAYKEFEEEILRLAKLRNQPIALSTSFGFDVTRFYVTAPASAYESPFLRVAIGTESLSQIKKLISLVEECSAKLALQWKDLSVAAPKATQPASTKLENLSGTKAAFKNTVYMGEDALHRYLSPENFAVTPLVELPADLNPFNNDGVRILAKMVPLVPLMNIKSIPAFSMLRKAAQRGELNGVKNIIESSSSNTVLSLSVISKLFGVDNTCAIVDHSIAPGLVRMLRLFGIEIYKHPAPGHELFGKTEARSLRAANMGKQDGWYNPNQYANPDNPEGFARWLAPELWAQTQGKLDVLSCALGTCGTMVGVSRELRSRKQEMSVVACCPARGEAVPGPREKMLLGDVAFPWQEIADSRMEMGAEESFAASIKLLRRGILGGPSSGMNYAGLLKYLGELRDSGQLEEAITKQGTLNAVFLCCDSPLPHIDEYFDALGEKYFPDVHEVPELSK